MSQTEGALLSVQNLSVSVADKKIISGMDLSLKAGEVHAIMGLNGSGKSSLCNALMGHPDYEVTGGDILFDGESLLELGVDERAKKRLFLGFQNPIEIPGVSVGNFLRTALKAIRGDEISVKEMRPLIRKYAAELNIPDSFLARSLNDGFSGGEKKRLETLQLKLLEPRVAIMDETDSGLDIDALKLVAQKINELKNENRAILLITHYQRLLSHIDVDRVHVMVDGKIIKSGDHSLAQELESKGYEALRAES